MLISELGFGGAEGAFLRLARALAKDNEVELVVFQQHYAVAGYTAAPIEAGLPVHRLDEGAAGGRVARWRHRAGQLRAVKERLRPDATISFLSGPNLLNAATRGPGLRLVSLRGSRVYDENSRVSVKTLFRHMLDPITFAGADGIVSVSEGVTREAARVRPGAAVPSRFRTISGYGDAEALIAAAEAPVEPEWRGIDGQPLVVAIGRLSVEKGFQHLVRVMAGVRRRIPEARLLLVGDGPYRAQLEAAAVAHGLDWSDDPSSDAAILSAGYRSAPLRFARLGKAFAVSSGAEGFPNVLVEALAAGVPVVAGDVPWGVREVMGIAADPANRPYPREEPLETPFGWLMPRIDDARFGDAWADRLAASLAAQPPSPEAVALARKRVRALDVGHAARQWSDFIHDLKRAKG